MNIPSAAAHVFHPVANRPDSATLARRQQCAEALDAARLGPADVRCDPDADAFDAQCRRVRESHYVDTPSELFHVC